MLQKTTDAKNKTIEAEGLESIQLAVMASRDDKGINTTSLAKNLSQINGLTDTNSQEISENTAISLPKAIKLNNMTYEINADGEVYKYYNLNGLVLLLDGINNTRNGHSSTTTTWEDLSGNNNDFTQLSGASNAVWSDNSFVGDATNRTLVLYKAILENKNECSVEVCYDVPQLKNYYWVFQSRYSNGSANGFQFYVSSSGRSVTIYNGNNQYNSLSSFKNVTDIKKRTMAFAVNSSNVIFSDNGQFYTEDTPSGIIQSLTPRNPYTIGSSYPWNGTENRFKGNVYSIRVYSKKLSEEELRNNYEVDRVRFNMD